MSGWFYNPYAFVPSDRYKASDGRQGMLADRPPASLGRLDPDRSTGRLVVTVKAKTPLLLTTIKGREENGHRRRATTRRHGDTDRADLLATSFKGMLRAAYEAATDSRFGVFTSGDRITRRVPARDAARLQPCRVAERDGEGATVRVLGKTMVGNKSLSAAAWVPRYDRCDSHDPEVGVCCARVPVDAEAHGQEMYALVAACIRPERGRQRDIPYWRVLDLASSWELLNQEQARQRLTRAGGHRHVENGRLRVAVGWYAETGRNVENKHYERFFISRFEDGDGVRHNPNDIRLEAADAHGKSVLDSWELVVTEYRERHRGNNRKVTIAGRDYGPFDYVEYEDNNLGEKRTKLALSRHVLPEYDGDEPLAALPVGTLCYAEFDKSDRLKALHPVAIGRRVFGEAPAELAKDQGLTPASTPEKASAADRLFGWADTMTAHRGRVRIAQCEQQDGGIEPLDGDGRPLAVLSSPKLQQGRFYAGGRDGGKLKRTTGAYSTGSGLRGRKVYPSAREPKLFKGGERADGKRDDKNASLLDWVPEGASFTIDIRVEDLEEPELGALAWLLSEKHQHRLGLGKPLGFGTVSISIDTAASTLAKGSEWAARYRLDVCEPTDVAAALESAKGNFVTEVSDAGDEPRFLRALRRALEGFGEHDVRYPPDPEEHLGGTEPFKWFGRNAKISEPWRLGDLADTHEEQGNWQKAMLLPVRPENKGDPPRPAAHQAPGPGLPGRELSEKGAGGAAPRSGGPMPTPRELMSGRLYRPEEDRLG